MSFYGWKKPSLRNPPAQAQGHMLLRVRAGIQTPASRHWVQESSTPHSAPHECALLLARHATSRPLCLRPSPSQQGEGRAPSYSTMAHSSPGPAWASRTPELRTLLPKLPWPPRVVAASRYLQSTPLPAARALLTKRSQELVLWTTTSPLLGRGAHCPGLACPQQA